MNIGCSVQNCAAEAASVCERCSNRPHFCKGHNRSHISGSGHLTVKLKHLNLIAVGATSKQEIQREINRAKGEIISVSAEIIINTKRIAKEAIKELERLNQNISDISQVKKPNIILREIQGLINSIQGIFSSENPHFDSNLSKKYSDSFSSWTIQQKLQFASGQDLEKLTEVSENRSVKIEDILLSSDKKYLFVCIFK